MKKSGPLKRYTPLRSHTRISQNSAFSGGLKPRKALRRKSLAKVPKIKDRIQALLRALAIAIYGNCVLAGLNETGPCFGPKQAEHLVTRANSVSFSDMRNIVLLCQRHHIYWKPQFSRLYWELIERIIGPERWEWIKKVEADTRPHRFYESDWVKAEIALAQELKKYETR